jgi:hypothetical protein
MPMVEATKGTPQMHYTSSASTLLTVAGVALSLASTNALASDASRELLADAAARTSYQGEGGGGTYGASGFNISDASGNNTLTIGGTLQFRYNLSFRDDSAVGDTADVSNGFSAPITRLRAQGTVGTKDLGYRIRGNFAQSDGVQVLEEAFGTYNFGNGWTATWGQFTLPTVRENINDSELFLGGGYSILSEFFSQGFSQGAMLTYEAERIRAFAAFSDGIASANTNFDSGLEADYALSLRLEGLLSGDTFSRFNDYTSFRSTSGNHMLLGGAVHWQDGGETNATTDQQLLLYTVDFAWEGPGYNISAAFIGQNIDPAGGTDRDDFGLNVQGGYFFSDNFEAFARLDALFLDSDSVVAPADDTQLYLTVGGNYYLFADSTAAKFTAQVGYSLDNPGTGTTSPTGSAFLGSGTTNGFMGQNDDGEIALQLFAQVTF